MSLITIYKNIIKKKANKEEKLNSENLIKFEMEESVPRRKEYLKRSERKNFVFSKLGINLL